MEIGRLGFEEMNGWLVCCLEERIKKKKEKGKKQTNMSGEVAEVFR